MRSVRSFALAAALLLSACPTPDPEPPPTDDDDDATAALTECEPALTLTSSVTMTVPLGLSAFVAEGGTGDYRFALVEDTSGAIVNGLTGAYLAGEVSGGTDVVEVTDLGCNGAAQASIEIVSAIEIVPAAAEVPPDAEFTFEIVGGSGEFDCEFVTNGGGGTLDGCTWTGPGAGSGTELVRAQDLRTEETADAIIEVTPDAALSLNATRLYLPLGAPYTLQISGGSGYFEGETISGGGVEVDFETVTLTAVEDASTTTLRFVDRFAGLTTDVTAVGVAPHPVSLDRAGNQELGGHAIAPGDVTGDGLPDALLSFQEADTGAFNGGVVLLFEGTSSGLAATPVRTWAGTGWDDEKGRGLAVGDFDGDGITDLAIGIPRDDDGGTDAGAVSIWSGLAEGGFAEEETTRILGLNGGNQAGSAVAACDFNGDGLDDLAIGAPRDEDDTALDPANNPGSVAIHLADEDGLPLEAATIHFGSRPDDGGSWEPVPNGYLGRHLAAGDFDGDGFCDLAAAAYEHTVDEGSSQDGAVWIWHGSADGVVGDPQTVLLADTGIVTGSNFGRALAVGDLDDDGRDDLIVGERNVHGAAASRTGAVHVFLGREDWGPRSQNGPALADWTVEGNSGSDYLGMYVQAADSDGDGVLDLIVSATNDERSGGPNNTGAVLVFAGIAGSPPDTTPTYGYYGAADGDWFGQEFAAVGDLDGDSWSDLLVLAGREASLGWNAGRPFALAGDPEAAAVPLDFEASPGGALVGRGLGFVDLDGDGLEELAIGAAGAGWADNRINTGRAWVFDGEGDGLFDEVGVELSDHGTAAGSDNLGWSTASAGDFDGDGWTDLGVLAEADEVPGTLDAALFADPEACGGEFPGSSSGALYLFGGSAGGVAPAPAFAWFGNDDGDGLMALGGGADLNGDGYDDLVVGSVDHDEPEDNDTGAVHVLFGRESNPAGTEVICSADWTWTGLAGGDRAGRSAAAIGDLNGDGCDEIAFGAATEDLDDLSNRGIVRVLWGWGGDGCPAEPTLTALGMLQSNCLLGWSMDGGHDVDGDGVPDLGVGAYEWNGISNDVGAAWVVPGAYLADLPAEPADTAEPVVHPLVPDDGIQWRIDGWINEEELGRGVALVPGLSDDGRAGLAAGGRHGFYSGVFDSGGARIHEFHLGVGFGEVPWAVLGGETAAGFFGQTIAATEGAVAVGGERADGLGIDAGAVYVLPLDAFDD